MFVAEGQRCPCRASSTVYSLRLRHWYRPHLPFIVPQAKVDLYPIDNVELPASQTPPKNMPSVAWSDSGSVLLQCYRSLSRLATDTISISTLLYIYIYRELIDYADINKIRAGKNLQPGDQLPAGWSPFGLVMPPEKAITMLFYRMLICWSNGARCSYSKRAPSVLLRGCQPFGRQCQFLNLN